MPQYRGLWALRDQVACEWSRWQLDGLQTAQTVVVQRRIVHLQSAQCRSAAMPVDELVVVSQRVDEANKDDTATEPKPDRAL
jgi:hypothetical protein